MAQWLVIICIALYGAIMGHLTGRIMQLMSASAFSAGARGIGFSPPSYAFPGGAGDVNGCPPAFRSAGFPWSAMNRNRLQLAPYPPSCIYESSCVLVFSAMLIIGGPGMNLPIGLLFGWFLLTLSWIDCLTLLLPDRLTGPLLACGLASHFTAWDGANAFLDGLLGAICGGMAFWGIQCLFKRVKGYEGLGGGDIKLLAALGAWLGWPALPGLCCGAALSGLAVYALSGGTQGKIPFGPCLALAGWVMYISP